MPIGCSHFSHVQIHKNHFALNFNGVVKFKNGRQFIMNTCGSCLSKFTRSVWIKHLFSKWKAVRFEPYQFRIMVRRSFVYRHGFVFKYVWHFGVLALACTPDVYLVSVDFNDFFVNGVKHVFSAYYRTQFCFQNLSSVLRISNRKWKWRITVSNGTIQHKPLITTIHRRWGFPVWIAIKNGGITG